MHQPKTTPEILDFYTTQCIATAHGSLTKVLEANGIPMTPASGKDLVPVPVYEAEHQANLFTVANRRARTTISWPAVPDPTFLQAYVKRYRKDGRMWNEIVVNTSNYCWARFYATKELMHCVTDDDGYPATDSIELVNELIESLIAGGGGLLKPQTIVDEIAWLGAAEYLVPSAWIAMIEKARTNLAAAMPEVNPWLHMAQLLRVPEVVLKARVKHHASLESARRSAGCP